MLFRYIMKDFETVSVAPVIMCITFLWTFRTRSMYVVRFSYYNIFEASFLIKFIFPEIVISVKRHVPFFPTDCVVRFIDRDGSPNVHFAYSIICSPYLHDLFELIFVQAHTRVLWINLPLFPSIRYSIIDQALYHQSLYSFDNTKHAGITRLFELS